MKRIIHLDTLEGLPGMFLQRLAKLGGIMKNEIFVDGLIREHIEVRRLTSEIDIYCRKHLIKCYHYTRSDLHEIKTQGLISRSGMEIRANFMDKYANLFSIEEIHTIKESWEMEFGSRGHKERDNRIFFNNTTVALHRGGAKILLDNYGGEQIHFPLTSHPEIQKKLSKIGEPLMVVFKASGAEACGIRKEFPWGETVVSTFQRTLNGEAFTSDVNGYIETAVVPRDILEIRKM